MWQVLVVEDDPVTRAFFVRCVENCAHLALVDAVGSLSEALAVLNVKGGSIDVLLTDLGLPDGSGLQVIRHALEVNSTIEPLVVSMFGDEDNVLAAIEAGALGYIHKDSAPDDVARVILEMREGASPISPMIARRMLSRFRTDASMKGPAPSPSGVAAPEAIVIAAPTGSSVALSPRESQVLGLIARGFSYAEIARLESLSIHTVQSHIKHIYVKLAVHSKNEAVFEATRMGLI